MQSLNRSEIRCRTEDEVHRVFATEEVKWRDNRKTAVGGKMAGGN